MVRQHGAYRQDKGMVNYCIPLMYMYMYTYMYMYMYIPYNTNGSKGTYPFLAEQPIGVGLGQMSFFSP